MNCPECRHRDYKLLHETCYDAFVQRLRFCEVCGHRGETLEVVLDDDRLEPVGELDRLTDQLIPLVKHLQYIRAGLKAVAVNHAQSSSTVF